MPSTIAKNLNLCFKCPSTNSSSLLTPDNDSRCPLFTSAAAAATSAFKNYNSLYDTTFDEYYSTSKPLLLTHSSSSISSSESDSEPDFASVFASQRFFFTSPGGSNSIIESIPPSSTTTSTPESSDTLIVATSSSPTANQPSSDDVDQKQQQQYSYSHATTSFPSSVKDSVAVSTLSPNPFMDFRRSMQEMVEARGVGDDVKANWDYLHELLLCYLAINPKTTHKFIIAAFADLLVSLMAADSGGGHVDGDIKKITGGKIPAGQCM